MSQDKKYDVFVSYKHSRHAADATSLVETLRRGGLTIWFDVDQLVKKNETWISKPELVSTLQSAVQQSRLSVVFAAAMEAVALPPGMTKEAALATGDCMVDEENGALIAWNWQKLEIDGSDAFIAVYADSCALHTHESRWRPFSSYEEMLREVERLVREYLKGSQDTV